MEQFDQVTRVELERPQEEGGIFALYGQKFGPITREVLLALTVQQYRGESTVGMALETPDRLIVFPGMGEVRDAFPQTFIDYPPSANIAMGSVQQDGRVEAPTLRSYDGNRFALSAAGNFASAPKILAEMGILDDPNRPGSEAVADRLAQKAQESGNLPKAFEEVLTELEDDTFCLAVISRGLLMYARDPRGTHPLWESTYGKRGFMIASEKAVIDTLKGRKEKEVEPGTLTVINRGILRRGRKKSAVVFEPRELDICAMEYVTMSRPDNVIAGKSVHSVRQETGRELARQYKIDGDVVVGIPDSGLTVAQGYAQESGIPYTDGFTKCRYAGRTHVDSHRKAGGNTWRGPDYSVINVIGENVEGKRVILADDSAIGGRTVERCVKAVQKAGAAEVHVIFGAPPVERPCFKGRILGDPAAFIARRMTVEDMAKALGADSVNYLPLESLLKSVGESAGSAACSACLTGGNNQIAVPVDIGPPRHGDPRLSHSVA